jgi:hypothetical protein
MPCQQCERMTSELKVREREHIMAVKVNADWAGTQHPAEFTECPGWSWRSTSGTATLVNIWSLFYLDAAGRIGSH